MAGFAPLTLPREVALGLQHGDPVAQAEAYRLLAPRVLGMAARILGDRGLAEEVVQDTFVSMIERGGTLESAAAAVGWIRQTAVNHCLMRLRSPWVQRRAAELPVDAMDPREDAPRAEGLRDLERALTRLGAETRMVLWLHDVEGYTHQEIGRLFGKTESYSKSQLARGYRKLLERTGQSEAEPLGDRKDDGYARATDLGPACAS